MILRFAHLRLPIVFLAAAALVLLAPSLARPPVAVAGIPITVNTTADTNDGCAPLPSGDCSLREAILAANGTGGHDMIEFDIPGTDSGCDVGGVCTIEPQTVLPNLAGADGATIDGYTQPLASANTNAFGQPINAVIKIGLKGGAFQVGAGISMSFSANNVIRGLAIYGFPGGVGILIQEDSAQNNVIAGNFMGLNPSGAAVGGGSVLINSGTIGPTGNTVGGPDPADRNLISGNGIGVRFGPALNNLVEGNYIGTDISGASALANVFDGVNLQSDSQGNSVVRNIIAFNGRNGIGIDGMFGQAINNTISKNSIHSNNQLGIDNLNGGNTELAPPVITATGSATGTACANCTVEVFSDDADQGQTFEGSTVADGNGDWSFPGAVTGPNITATATDASGNTSEFSTPFSVVDLIQGDNDCDNDADSVDALKGLQHLAGFSTNQQPGCPTLGVALPAALPAGAAPALFGDVDCDDDVDSVDALKILRSVAAFSVTQNEPCTNIGDPF